MLGCATVTALLANAATTLFSQSLGDESAAIVLYAPERPGHSARPALDRFIAANLDILRDTLGQARDGRP